MIKYLEKLLYQKTEGTQSEILFAQWNYDKKIIPTALNAVSNLFPHYSLHDESHSITIINNIVRVLGKEKIENLSAIDIWLILEASYSHDIGMVVSSEKLIEALSSSDFIDFFIEIQQDKKNGLHDFANQFKIDERKIKYNSSELNLEYHDGIKFILAEYFRRNHSDRSKDIIINPKEELQLSTPRGVIPQRIFKILADICSSHTKNFEDVMKLPFCEVGIDIEDSHPRFVSCLLRIGDLLDLDNNRFSEVMLRTLSKIPVDTLNHKAKHLSIESFRVDNKIIEVKAKCSDYDTANITQHWFNYLNSEISQQMNNWNKIVPFKEFGYLPTIGNLKVELSNYDYIDGKKKPKFSVDTDKALELLQGAGIYEGAYQCMREILQNAVDATLLRIWLEYKDELDLKSPNTEDFNKIIGQFHIKIEINEKEVIGKNKIWELNVTDKGIGLSTYDLNYLMNTGSSSKNRKKLNIIDTMPLWLRPSGTFGIGFQSIFMLTEQVNIETKSFFNEEFQIIELNSPNSIKDGGILVQKKKTSHIIKPHTKLTFNHKTKAIPERWSIKGEHRNASRIAHNYDPFSHESLDIELGKIFDEIFDFSLKSHIPINFYLNNVEIDTHSNKNKFKYFDDENSLELNIYSDEKENGWRIITYYKNQHADNELKTMFLGFELNIHKHKASDVLTLNRNKIKPEYNQELRKQFLTSSFKVIISNFDEIFQNEESKGIASMFLNYYHDYNDFLSHFDIKKYNQWQKLKINIEGKDIEMNKLLNSIDSVKLVYDKRAQLNSDYGDIYELKGKELSINLRGGSPSFDYTHFLLHKISGIMSSIQKIKNVETNFKEIYFSKKKQKSPVNDSEIKNILINTKNSFYSSRSIIPCIEKYFKLRLNDDANESYVYHYKFDYYINLQYPKMLSPYISDEDENDITNLKLVLNDKLYDWVYKNRYDSKITLDEIKKNYEEFIAEFKIEDLN